MVDEVIIVVFTLNICTKYVDWSLYATVFFPLYDRRIESGPLCKLRSRLLVAAGGSLRFGYQHPAPRRIRRRGTLSE